MAKRRKSKRKQKLTILAVLVGIALIFSVLMYVGTQQSILQSGGTHLPDEEQSFVWLGNDGVAFAPKFESLTSSNDIEICGDSDGKITISNSYTSNTKLTLKSTASGQKGCTGNMIKASVTLPPGTLKVTCDIKATDTLDYGALSFCSISGLLSGSVYSKGSPPNFDIDGGIKTKSILEEYQLNESKTINIVAGGSIGTSTAGQSSYSSTIALEFTELVVDEEPEDNETSTGSETNGDTTTNDTTNGDSTTNGGDTGTITGNGSTPPDKETSIVGIIVIIVVLILVIIGGIILFKKYKK